jgi:hypothetical protein
VARFHGLVTGAPSRRATIVTLALLMALAAGLLLAGLTRDLPSPEPDEPFFVLPAVQMAANGSANPHWFGHPASTVITPLAIVYRAREVLFHGAPLTGAAPGVVARYRHDPSSFYLLARLWVMVLTVLTVPLVFLVGRRLFPPLVALLAAGAWTLLPLVLDYGRLVRSDSAATCFGLLAFLACLRALERPGALRFALAGGAIGLAVSSRYFMVTLFVVLAGAWWLARRDTTEERGHVSFWSLVGGGGAALAVFALTTPFFFLDASEAERSLTAESAGHFNSASHGHLANIGYYLFHALPDTLSWPGYVLAVAGIVLAVVRRDRLRLLAAVFVGAFLLLLCSADLHWQRWVIPVLPFLLLFATSAVVDGATAVARRGDPAHHDRRFVAAMGIGMLIVLVVPAATVAFDTYATTVPTTREAMRADVVRDVPKGARVAVELKGPSLGTAGHPTWHGYDLPKSGTVADYVAHGYHYLVVNTYLALQYRLHHERWPLHSAFYQFLRWHGHLLADERPHGTTQGPHLKLYRVDDTSVQRTVGRPVRATTQRSGHDRLGGRSREYPVGGDLYDSTG